MLALPFDTAVYYLNVYSFLLGLHAEQGTQCLGLLVTSFMADGNAGIACEDQDLIIIPVAFISRM